jgi:hypothetical protein
MRVAVGYHLRRQDLPLLIVHAHEQIGGAWPNGWNSLRPFSVVVSITSTACRFRRRAFRSSPGIRWSTKQIREIRCALRPHLLTRGRPNQPRGIARAYLARGVRDERLSRRVRFLIQAGGNLFGADHVVAAMATTSGRVPEFASELAPSISAAAFRWDALQPASVAARHGVYNDCFSARSGAPAKAFRRWPVRPRRRRRSARRFPHLGSTCWGSPSGSSISTVRKIFASPS